MSEDRMSERSIEKMFSSTRYRQHRLESISRISVVASVSIDGDDVILELYPGPVGTYYKLPARSVEVVPNSLDARLSDGSTRALHRVLIDRLAPCTRVTESVVEDLLKLDVITPRGELLLTTLQVQIAFGANGEGTLAYGTKSAKCLGNVGRAYPTDLTIEGIEGVDKYPVWHSTEFDVDMKWAVKIWGQKGIFIHEGPNNLNDNGGSDSAGCIHLGAPDAEVFYNWISGRCRMTISYPW